MFAPSEPAARRHTCEAGDGCEREACFQARVEATAGHNEIRRRAHACGRHLTDVVQALCAWVRNSDISNGCLTVFAVDPQALRLPHHRGDPSRHADPGFPFYALAISRRGAGICVVEGCSHV
ncbi:MAG TPA: hypothetical protein VMA73_13270 [Streptosporangiaceae bacterium]|nr:hypothetical protein [Streptosporangiaceae bacterium]